MIDVPWFHCTFLFSYFWSVNSLKCVPWLPWLFFSCLSHSDFLFPIHCNTQVILNGLRRAHINSANTYTNTTKYPLQKIWLLNSDMLITFSEELSSGAFVSWNFVSFKPPKLTDTKRDHSVCLLASVFNGTKFLMELTNWHCSKE